MSDNVNIDGFMLMNALKNEQNLFYIWIFICSKCISKQTIQINMILREFCYIVVCYLLFVRRQNG